MNYGHMKYELKPDKSSSKVLGSVNVLQSLNKQSFCVILSLQAHNIKADGSANCQSSHEITKCGGRINH